MDSNRVGQTATQIVRQYLSLSVWHDESKNNNIIKEITLFGEYIGTVTIHEVYDDRIKSGNDNEGNISIDDNLIDGNFSNTCNNKMATVIIIAEMIMTITTII